jgi:SAM-dependent methyltransferase
MKTFNNRTIESNVEMKQEDIKSSPFNDVADEYDTWFDKDGSLIFSIEKQAFIGLLPELPKPWIEIGVGSGRFAQALGIETGVDPSSELLRLAKKRGIDVFLGRGEQDVFNKESFGTVFFITTVCFLDSPLEVLNQANRILAPEGKLVLGVILKESPWGQFYEAKGANGHHLYKYAHFYSCDELVKLIVRADFLIENIVSTLYQRPGEVHHMEEPKEGYSPEAGFTIIVAGKRDIVV